MAESPPSSRLFRAVVFVATVLTVASWIFLIDNNLFSQRERFQESDFIMTFYVAGQLVLAGRSDELYPAPQADSFVNSPFDIAAHEILPHLPKESIGAYMYTPLVAGFFAPLSLAGANYSLLIWQVLSVLALAFSCWLLARVSMKKPSDVFFLTSLYAPVFLTLWAGQLGLGFGLAPLCAGYFLLLRQWPFAAGLVWSILLFKPQYFLAAVFITLILALSGRYRTFAGMTLGVVVLLGLTTIFFSPELTLHWLQSHRVSDSIFSSGLHGIPAHLITGLPANLMILFPPEARAALKWPLYAGAALLWLVGLWFGVNLARVKLADPAWISLALVLGVLLCALTLPHLLYYDLCVLLPAGVLLLGKHGPLPDDKAFRFIGVIGWIVVSAALPLLLVYNQQRMLPLMLELFLLVLWMAFLIRLKTVWKSPACA
ncbi:MAG: glycosyltransferase family 87 protein [Candidatus Binatia bacterium]